jgi:hypothetical protein
MTIPMDLTLIGEVTGIFIFHLNLISKSISMCHEMDIFSHIRSSRTADNNCNSICLITSAVWRRKWHFASPQSARRANRKQSELDRKGQGSKTLWPAGVEITAGIVRKRNTHKHSIGLVSAAKITRDI